MSKLWFALAAAALSGNVWADAIGGAVQKQPLNVAAVVMFLIFVGATLFITKWAAKQNKSSRDFSAAVGCISGF